MTTGFDPNAGKTSGIITSSTPSPLVGPIPVGTQRPTASAAITKATESDLIKEYGRKSDAQRKALAAKLKAAGYRVPVTGAYSSEVRDAFIAANTALSNEIATLQQSDPSRLAKISYDLDSYLDNIAAQRTSAVGGGGPQVTAYPEITNEQDGRITINKYFQDNFGRDATDAEFKAAYNDIIKQQKAKPRKQTITRNAKGEKVISYTGGTNTEQILNDWVAKKPKLQSEADTYEASDANVLKREKEKELYDKELAKLGGDPDKIAALNASTSYGRSIQSMQNKIARIALEAGAQFGAEELAKYAKEAIDTSLDKDAESLTAFINDKLKFGKDTGGMYTGVAGTNVDALTKVAAANGLDLEKVFGAQLPDWLSAINKGESIETYKRIIRDVAKFGMPEKVTKLIDQGLDLATIYAPYKNLMASTLEINPQTIDLNDPTLRSAITADAEVPLYEFERALRQDNRWQYTNTAKEEVANATRKILQDFGFMG